MMLRPSSINQKSFQAPAPVLKVLDTFTDVNGTLITAHTPNTAPVGSAWAVAGIIAALGATPTISSNRLSLGGNNTGCVIDCGVVNANVYATRPAEGTNRRNVRFFIRYSSNGNTYVVEFLQETDVINICSRIAGVNAVLATVGYSFTPGTAQVYRAETNGAVVTVYVDGVQVLQYSTMTLYLTSRFYGLCKGGATTGVMDDFTVYSVL